MYQLLSVRMFIISTIFLYLFFGSATGASISNSIFDNGNGGLSYPLSLISDQDKGSRDKRLGLWFSTLVSANLIISKDRRSAFIHFLSRKNYTSMWNYNGRGMELSDLKMFNGNLISVDDKTGLVYRLKGNDTLPWAILRDGDGTADTPFKGEWLAVKDDHIYCGGYGKEKTTDSGDFVNENPFWIKRISEDGAVESLDWKENFLRLREHLDIHFPGYMIHESAQWSDIHRRWFFLPRHMSKLTFNAATTYLTGANVLLSVAEDFSDINHVVIGKANMTKGFSAFQFVPGTNDEVIVALKSVEIPDEDLNSFIMVFDINGEILMEEVEIPGNLKCEGVEFYDSQLGIYPFQSFRDHVPLRSEASGLHLLPPLFFFFLSYIL